MCECNILRRDRSLAHVLARPSRPVFAHVARFARAADRPNATFELRIARFARVAARPYRSFARLLESWHEGASPALQSFSRGPSASCITRTSAAGGYEGCLRSSLDSRIARSGRLMGVVRGCAGRSRLARESCRGCTSLASLERNFLAAHRSLRSGRSFARLLESWHEGASPPALLYLAAPVHRASARTSAAGGYEVPPELARLANRPLGAAHGRGAGCFARSLGFARKMSPLCRAIEGVARGESTKIFATAEDGPPKLARVECGRQKGLSRGLARGHFGGKKHISAVEGCRQ